MTARSHLQPLVARPAVGPHSAGKRWGAPSSTRSRTWRRCMPIAPAPRQPAAAVAHKPRRAGWRR
eukprot:1802091-Lingulodinium_polyedra.AAC.1